MWRRCPYRLRSGTRQAGLRHPDLVDRFKALMLANEWDFQGQGSTFVYWRDGRTVWVSEGHHRANAALEIGRASGDWSYLDRLLEHGKREPDLPPPANRGRFPTRGWLSRCLTMLGW
jgi:filamentous hemagglutinin